MQTPIIPRKYYNWFKKFGIFTIEPHVVDDEDMLVNLDDSYAVYQFIKYTLPKLGVFNVPIVVLNEFTEEVPKNLVIWFTENGKEVWGPPLP